MDKALSGVKIRRAINFMWIFLLQVIKSLSNSDIIPSRLMELLGMRMNFAIMHSSYSHKKVSLLTPQLTAWMQANVRYQKVTYFYVKNCLCSCLIIVSVSLKDFKESFHLLVRGNFRWDCFIFIMTLLWSLYTLFFRFKNETKNTTSNYFTIYFSGSSTFTL